MSSLACPTCCYCSEQAEQCHATISTADANAVPCIRIISAANHLEELLLVHQEATASPSTTATEDRGQLICVVFSGGIAPDPPPPSTPESAPHHQQKTPHSCHGHHKLLTEAAIMERFFRQRLAADQCTRPGSH